MTDKLDLLRQIGADMQADPERGFENWEFLAPVCRAMGWAHLVGEAEDSIDWCRIHRSPKPLITHDQIPWKWLKWDWVAMDQYGNWYIFPSEPYINQGVYWSADGGWAYLAAIKMPSIPPERWRETKMRRPE